MKNYVYVLGAIVVVLVLTASTCADRGGLLDEFHDAPIDENTIRVEVRGFDALDIVSTGERGDRPGEIHKVAISLSAPGELSTNEFTGPLQISNRTPGDIVSTTFETVKRADQVDLFAGDRFVDGVRSRMPALFVNANRNARLTLSITTLELDCSGDNICNRDNTGTVAYAFTLPSTALPEVLPDDCGPTNTLRWGNESGTFQFSRTINHQRTATDEPILEPLAAETDATICFLPVVDE